MKRIKVSFTIVVGEWPDTRCTEEHIVNAVKRLGENILDAYDETICDLKSEVVAGD